MDISREQMEFRNSKPSKLGRGIERLTHPFGKAIAGMVPKSIVESAMKGIDEATSYPKLVEFSHDPADMDASQKAAKRVVRAARAVSASTGAAAGFGGALSMGLDIPATIAIALRTIRDTGRAYGFDGEGADEKMFRLKILELSALDGDHDRDLRIAELVDSIADDGTLRSPDHKEITPVIDQVVERVSRAVALASFRKRLGMVVPIAGAAIGGIVNSSFQNDVGKAARFAFQARRLKQDIP
ncbi:MAG: EcsC family protein [Pontixanthobacter sp.]